MLREAVPSVSLSIPAFWTQADGSQPGYWACKAYRLLQLPFPSPWDGEAVGERKGHWKREPGCNSPTLCPWADHIASLSLTKAGITPHLMGSLESPCPSWICSPDEFSLHCLLNLLSSGSGGTQSHVAPGHFLRTRYSDGKGAFSSNINV